MKNKATITGVVFDGAEASPRERDALFVDFAAAPLMAWGAVWALCHLNGQWFADHGTGMLGFHPDVVGRVVTLLEFGITFACLMVLLGLRYASSPRADQPDHKQARATLLLIVWVVFYLVGSQLLRFKGGLQSNTFSSLYWMLLLLVYGFWFSSGIFLSVALVTSACTLIGYVLMPNQYHLWAGIGGGGALFLGGVCIWIKGGLCRSDADASEADDIEKEG